MMLYQKKLRLIFFMVGYFIFSTMPHFAVASKVDTVMVLGYFSQLTNKLWQNSHVGFGIQNQLKQEVFNSKRYDLKEEKKLYVKEQASVQDSKLWMLNSEDISMLSLENKASVENVDLLFWVEVIKFGHLKSDFLLGIFSSKTKKTTLTAKVCVFIKKSQLIQCELGYGRSRRKSSSFFYVKKEHKQGSKMFDGTLVGKISNVAIKEALSKLFTRI